tara:strand:- start:2261 stop:3085 length:825 start_codon:yes stop_codon:yes gene_type:complete
MLGLFTTLSATANHKSFGDSFGTRHSLLFDGSNDEVDFTSTAFQQALNEDQGNFKNSGSVSIWARFENTSINGQVWDFAIDTNNRIQLQYKQATDSLTLTFKGNAGSKTQALASYDPVSGLEGDSTFHHIACTWDTSAGNMKLYVDGSLRTTSNIEDVVINGDFDDTADGTPGAAGTGGVEFMAGTSFTGAADFKGYLDDFAVYSSVLTSSEVTTLYNSGVSNQSNVNSVGTIVAYWTFNEGTGNVVTDRVGAYDAVFGSGDNAPQFSTTNAGG